MDRLARVLAHMDPEYAGAGGVAQQRFEVVEKEDRYIVVVDVPGCSRSDVQVMVEDVTDGPGAGRALLTISAERKPAVPESRRRGSLRHALYLPRNVDEAGLSAKCHNGVLVLTLPKTRPDPSRHVSVD